MTTEKINGQNFIIGSRRHILYNKYFKYDSIKESLDNKNTRRQILTHISQETNIPLKYIIWYYSKVKKSYNITLSRVEQIIPEDINSETTNKYIDVLDLKIKDEDNGLFLYVKSCKEYEDYLIKTKEIHDTQDLFREDKDAKFYFMRLVDNYLDAINSPIFYTGQINFAVLRLVGISNGLKFKIDNLLTEKQIKDGLDKLKDVFTQFYKNNIDKIKINYSVRLIEEKDDNGVQK